MEAIETVSGRTISPDEIGGLFGVPGLRVPTGSERYETLRKRWRQETMFRSWLDDIVSSPGAKAIVRMGERAVTCIERDVRQNVPETWGLLGILTLILGEGPEIPDEDRGRVDRHRELWLAWLAARKRA